VADWDRDALQDLRAAVWRHDLAAIRELCEGRELDDVLQLAVDLEDLSMLLDGDPVHGGGRIDLATGEIWPGSPYDDPIDDGDDDPERWLWVEAGSRAGWADMAAFAATVANPALADRLDRAIHGRGPFRHFHAVLDTAPAELTRFHRFADERRRGRARRWLAEHGLGTVQRGP